MRRLCPDTGPAAGAGGRRDRDTAGVRRSPRPPTASSSEDSRSKCPTARGPSPCPVVTGSGVRGRDSSAGSGRRPNHRAHGRALPRGGGARVARRSRWTTARAHRRPDRPAVGPGAGDPCPLRVGESGARRRAATPATSRYSLSRSPPRRFGHRDGGRKATSAYTPDTGALVYGWGDTSGAGDYANGLHAARVRVLPDAACERAYPGSDDGRYLREHHALRGGGGRWPRRLSGDSGGRAGQPGGRLIGLVVRGAAAGARDSPGVYTRVSSILRTLGWDSTAVRQRGGVGCGR